MAPPAFDCNELNPLTPSLNLPIPPPPRLRSLQVPLPPPLPRFPRPFILPPSPRVATIQPPAPLLLAIVRPQIVAIAVEFLPQIGVEPRIVFLRSPNVSMAVSHPPEVLLGNILKRWESVGLARALQLTSVSPLVIFHPPFSLSYPIIVKPPPPLYRRRPLRCSSTSVG